MFIYTSILLFLVVSLYNIYLVLGPPCKPLLVMELPNKRLLLLLLLLLNIALIQFV